MSVEPVEILRYARDVVLEDESKWTSGTPARDAKDNQTAVEYGAKFCVLGAVQRAEWELTGEYGCEWEWERQLRPLFPDAASITVDYWNDSLYWLTLHEDRSAEFSQVLDGFDAAIKSLEDPC